MSEILTDEMKEGIQRIEVMTNRGAQLLADIRKMPNKTEQDIVIGRMWKMFTEATDIGVR